MFWFAVAVVVLFVCAEGLMLLRASSVREASWEETNG